MHVGYIDLLLWAAAFAGHITLLAVIFVRHRIRAFPLFTVLIAVNVLKSLILYLTFLQGSKSSYFYTYVFFLILDLTLQLAVVFEMASRVFRPVNSWGRDVARNLFSLAIASVLLAVGLTFLAQPHTRLPVKAAIIRFDLFSAVLVSALFVGFVVLSVRAALPWRTHVARISQGLAVYSVVDVVLESARTCFGLNTTTALYVLLSQVRIAVYCACLVYWIVTLWQDAPAPKSLNSQMRWQLAALQDRVAHDLASIRLRRK
ncbi:MAG TPA: hypothetical protein VFW25_10630 [Silvibacterium sp.]|nr:hypothetical protein [Silvibacterium sp.]